MIRTIPVLRSVLGLLACVCIFGHFSQAAETTLSDPYAKVRSFTMANGLKVVLAPDTDAKTFQIKVRVDVGVFNEEENKAGIIFSPMRSQKKI
jgi:hypothetical protein